MKFYTRLLSIICAIGCLFWIQACKNDEKPATDPAANAATPPKPDKLDATVLGGHWVAVDFCGRANQYGSVLAAMNNAHKPYSYAFTFMPSKPDSVMCYNGFESWMLPIQISYDTLIEVKEAVPGKSVFLAFNRDDQSLTLFDGVSGPRTQMDRFIKSKASSKDGYMAFLIALNHNLFSGIFLQPRSKAEDKPIQFTPGGLILNFSDYDKYEICTAGDCFVAGQDIDVLTLKNSKKENSDKFFGFRYRGDNDTLLLYNLVDKTPGEKGGYQPAGIAYSFVRKKAER